MNKQYDVIIVGAGPMGIFTAYELMNKCPEKKVLVIEQGHDIYSRKCPILMKKISKCPFQSLVNQRIAFFKVFCYNIKQEKIRVVRVSNIIEILGGIFSCQA